MRLEIATPAPGIGLEGMFLLSGFSAPWWRIMRCFFNLQNHLPRPEPGEAGIGVSLLYVIPHYLITGRFIERDLASLAVNGPGSSS
jgi:hypothetical protein